MARKFLAELMEHKELRGLLSDEHFSVDGTQIAAWASMKSFKAKDGSSDPPGSGRNGERDFHGEKRSNATHASSTDPEAQLYRKGRGKEAKLSFMGHVLMENRSGLIVAATLTKATGTAEREAAEAMIVRHSPGARRITLGADKGYDAAAFVADMRNAQRDAAHRTEHQRPAFRHRCPYHAARRLCGEPAKEKAYRGTVRLGQDDLWARTAHAPRCQKARLQVHSHNGRLQSKTSAKAHRGHSMSLNGHPRRRTSPCDFRQRQPTGFKSRIKVTKMRISAAC